MMGVSGYDSQGDRSRSFGGRDEPGSEEAKHIEQREVKSSNVQITIESRVSAEHPDRNEDAALGDLGRIRNDQENPPKIETASISEDLEMVRRAGKLEERFAEQLRERNVYGSFDGVSGSRYYPGTGLLGSRLTSAKISESMAKLPIGADAETARAQIEVAMNTAHQAVNKYKTGRADLGQMATTADIVKTVDHDNGTFDLAYGHAGDGRIYIFDEETKKLECITIDDGYAGQLLREGGITREDYDLVVNAQGADTLPENLRPLYLKRNVVVKVIGLPNLPDLQPETGVVKGLIKGRHKILLTSDGVHDNLTNDEIEKRLAQGETLKDIIGAAAQHATSKEKRAKPDDVTGTLIEFKTEPRGKIATPRAEEKVPISEKKIEMYTRFVADALTLDELKEAIRTIGKIETAKGVVMTPWEINEWIDTAIKLPRTITLGKIPDTYGVLAKVKAFIDASWDD